MNIYITLFPVCIMAFKNIKSGLAHLLLAGLIVSPGLKSASAEAPVKQGSVAGKSEETFKYTLKTFVLRYYSQNIENDRAEKLHISYEEIRLLKPANEPQNLATTLVRFSREYSDGTFEKSSDGLVDLIITDSFNQEGKTITIFRKNAKENSLEFEKADKTFNFVKSELSFVFPKTASHQVSLEIEYLLDINKPLQITVDMVLIPSKNRYISYVDGAKDASKPLDGIVDLIYLYRNEEKYMLSREKDFEKNSQLFQEGDAYIQKAGKAAENIISNFKAVYSKEIDKEGRK